MKKEFRLKARFFRRLPNPFLEYKNNEKSYKWGKINNNYYS